MTALYQHFKQHFFYMSGVLGKTKSQTQQKSGAFAMQFSNLAIQDHPFFTKKAVDPAASSKKQGRAVLIAGLLQRVATEVSIAAAARHPRGPMPHALGQWIAPNRLRDASRLPDAVSVPALLRATGRPQDHDPPPPPGRRRPRLSSKLQKLAQALSDDDLAVAIGQMKVLVKARRRAA
jgi:hypothetical protein